MSISGIIIIDKPAGWTSFDVCAKLRNVLHERRIGHGGTLDPMATGVLPVFIGCATRAVEFCENADKEYIAGLQLGIVTNTQDTTGKVISEQDATVNPGGKRITACDIATVLPRFLGKQNQIPPMYSAIKQNGKRLYDLARQGVEVERKVREIEIKSIELLDEPADAVKQSIFYLRVTCTKGTYIRTLCHDIGQTLGCGAAMSYLRRTRAGAFSIEQAHTLDEIIAQIPPLLPVDSIFSQYPSIMLDEKETHKARNGALRHTINTPDGKYRFYAPNGDFLLFGEIKNNEVKTIKNFLSN